MNPLLQALIKGDPPAEARPGESPLAPRPREIQKMRYNHQAMVDLLVAQPTLTQNELADIFDRSPSWISTIICSEVFQDQLAKRREEILGPEILQSFKTQHEGLLLRSMAVLREKMNRKVEEIPDQLALQVLKVTGQNLGLAHAGETRVSIQETHVHLDELGKNLVGLLRRRRVDASQEYVDGEVTHPQPHSSAPAEGQAQLPPANAPRLARSA